MMKTKLCLTLICAVALTSSVSGQGKNLRGVGSADQLNRLSGGTDGRLPTVRERQSNLQNLAENPNVFRGKDIYRLLDFESVRKELELVPEQLEEYKQLQKSIRDQRTALLKAMNEQRRQMSDLPPEERRSKLLESHKELTEKLADLSIQKKDFLLDHQVQRLEQIATGLKFQSMGPYGALADPDISEILELRPEQLKKLKEMSIEFSKELEKKVLELKRDYRKQLIDELDLEQREKLEDLIGDSFELKSYKR